MGTSGTKIGGRKKDLDRINNNLPYEYKMERSVINGTFGSRDMDCSLVCPDTIDYVLNGECRGCRHYQEQIEKGMYEV